LAPRLPGHYGHVVSDQEHFGNMIICFHVDGDFNKSNLPDPLILTHYFTVRDDRICQLVIPRNKVIAF
jgi:hypothetical protein